MKDLALRIGLIAAWLVLATCVGLAYPLLTKSIELQDADWQWPWFLLVLLLLPPVFWMSTFGHDRFRPRLRLGSLGPLPRGPRGVRSYLRDLPGCVRTVALALFVLALCRPLSTIAPETTREEGIDLVVVLDLSGSMASAMDNMPDELQRFVTEKRPGVRPTRLDAAKAVIQDFISRRKTDRIGVVVFAKDAYVLSPPTLDYYRLNQLVGAMKLDLIDRSATAIGDATGVAVARLRRSQAKSKAIILLTDGDSNAGKISPEYAAHLATVVGAKVFTIQIGDGKHGEVLQGFTRFNQPRYVQQPFPVNPELLKSMADKTGGQMYVASDASTLQASFHDVLDRLEKTLIQSNTARLEELYRYFLLPAVLLIALEALLRVLVLRRFP